MADDDFIKPFAKNKKQHEMIFNHLMKKNIYYSNDFKINRQFGRVYKNVIDKDLMDLAPVSKKNKYIIAIPPEIRLVKRKGRYYFYRIE